MEVKPQDLHKEIGKTQSTSWFVVNQEYKYLLVTDDRNLYMWILKREAIFREYDSSA